MNTPQPPSNKRLRAAMSPFSKSIQQLTAPVIIKKSTIKRNNTNDFASSYFAPSVGGVAARRNLQTLRRNNVVLEKILAGRKEKESLMEGKIAEMGASLKRSKGKALQATIRMISSSLFLLLIAALIWGNWRMFSPHFDAMTTAALCAGVLHPWQNRVVQYAERLKHQAKLWTKLVCILAAIISFPVGMYFGIALAAGLLMAPLILLTTLSSTPSRTLASFSLSFIVAVTICAPFVWVLKSVAHEMDYFARVLARLMENQDDLTSFVAKLNQFSFIRWLASTAKLDESYSVEDLNKLVEYIASSAGANSALVFGLLSNLSNLIWAFGTFAVTLFTLLSLDIEIHKTRLAYFSPLSSTDNEDVIRTVTSGTLQVFVGSAGVGLVHGSATYFMLAAVHCPICMLPAFASACLAVAPVFGTFVVWIPFVLWFYVMDQAYAAALLTAGQIFISTFIDPWLAKRFPSSAQLLGGLPVVAGLFAFGPCGIFYGPLVVGISVVTANIYLRYVAEMTTAEDDVNHYANHSTQQHDEDDEEFGDTDGDDPTSTDDSFCLPAPKTTHTKFGHVLNKAQMMNASFS